jgi:hypothetical protein
MANERRYGNPRDFRRALTDRLKHAAKDGRWTLPQLQRQIAYDRLLQRLYMADRGWVLKGAAALLARDIGVRATIDIDLYRGLATEVAERDLREAAAQDIGDWFRFEIGPAQPVRDGATGVRLPVAVFIGVTRWVEFRVDLVGAGVRMTGEPEDVPPLARIDMPDVEQQGYRAYPLVDHVADKLAATFDRYGQMEAPSTRYRDLVDLVAIAMGASVEAEPQMAALASEAERRGITPPRRFDVPARDLWESGYAREARDALPPTPPTLDEALAVVRPFVNPLLEGTAHGRWDPKAGRWVD